MTPVQKYKVSASPGMMGRQDSRLCPHFFADDLGVGAIFIYLFHLSFRRAAL